MPAAAGLGDKAGVSLLEHRDEVAIGGLNIDRQAANDDRGLVAATSSQVDDIRFTGLSMTDGGWSESSGPRAGENQSDELPNESSLRAGRRSDRNFASTAT